MILKLTQSDNGLPCLVSFSSEFAVIETKQGTTNIGNFDVGGYVEVKETVEEILQQIKEGGACGTNVRI
jgi:hypothetical protein